MPRLSNSDSGRGRFNLSIRGLLLVIAAGTLIAVIAGRAVRRQIIRGNERDAIRALARAGHSQWVSISGCEVDQDGDGSGEFAFLRELSGVAPLRVDGGVTAQPSFPPCLTTWYGASALAGGGIATRYGYHYRVWLPSHTGQAIGETGAVVPGDARDASLQEWQFAIYAWPVRVGVTGNRAFVITVGGELFTTENLGAQHYSGREHMPAPGAALVASPPDATQEEWEHNPYRRESEPAPDLRTLQNLFGQLTAGVVAGDGHVWNPIPHPFR